MAASSPGKRRAVAVIGGTLLGGGIYLLAAVIDLPEVHVVLAPTLAGAVGSSLPGGLRARVLGGTLAALLAALLVLLYYAAVALHAVKALLSAGALGLLPLPVAALFGLLGALAREAMRRALRRGP